LYGARSLCRRCCGSKLTAGLCMGRMLLALQELRRSAGADSRQLAQLLHARLERHRRRLPASGADTSSPVMLSMLREECLAQQRQEAGGAAPADAGMPLFFAALVAVAHEANSRSAGQARGGALAGMRLKAVLGDIRVSWARSARR